VILSVPWCIISDKGTKNIDIMQFLISVLHDKKSYLIDSYDNVIRCVKKHLCETIML